MSIAQIVLVTCYRYYCLCTWIFDMYANITTLIFVIPAPLLDAPTPAEQLNTAIDIQNENMSLSNMFTIWYSTMHRVPNSWGIQTMNTCLHSAARSGMHNDLCSAWVFLLYRHLIWWEQTGLTNGGLNFYLCAGNCFTLQLSEFYSQNAARKWRPEKE